MSYIINYNILGLTVFKIHIVVFCVKTSCNTVRQDTGAQKDTIPICENQFLC
jgi:hypothetical protein